MRLTLKLLGRLNRVFDKDPHPFAAIRFGYAGGMSWAVEDLRLVITISGGVGGPLTIDLTQHTLATLAATIAGAAGYQVDFIDPERAHLAATILLDGAGEQDASGRVQLLGYTSLLWSFMEAEAVELKAADGQIGQMLRQMTTKTAEGAWLDELGSYYNVPRWPGEADVGYGPRIVAEAVRPASNNIALERAIQDYTGRDCRVLDVTIYRGVFPVYDGVISHDGAYTYSTVGSPEYGLFDVQIGYDLIDGGSFVAFLADVREILTKIRAAGTHIRALSLDGSASLVLDVFGGAIDGGLAEAAGSLISETLTAPSDGAGVPLSGGVTLSGDSLAAPADDAAGLVDVILLTESGVEIFAEDGSKIFYPIGPMF